MREAEIRKKALEILRSKKWVCWYPKKVRFHETDIFGIADLICCQKSRLRLIQLTTTSNVSSRRKKIMNCLKKFKIDISVEIWSWNKKKRGFKREVSRRKSRG